MALETKNPTKELVVKPAAPRDEPLIDQRKASVVILADWKLKRI